MQQTLLTEIPSSLKQLARLVVRGFYDIEYCLIVDMLVRYPCMREDDIEELLKFDRKILRARLSTLKADRFVQVKLKIETGEDGKAAKVNCYFINYKIFVNIVKYKLDHMRKKMETEERDATSRSSFRCIQCGKQFSDLEADQLFDMQTGEFKCTFCGAVVEEDEAAMPKKDSRLLLAKFNDQMERLYELLRVVEDIKLAPEVLEPDPVDISNTKSAQDRRNGPASGDPNDGNWTGERSRGGGFRQDDQQVNITFGDKETNKVAKKEVPIWISESTVMEKKEPGEDAVAAMGPSMSMVTEETAATEPDDEITNLLLRHERTNKVQAVIPGVEDSDSDNKSDDSDVEDNDTVERDALLLAQRFNEDAMEEEDAVGEMDDDDDDELPVVKVGNEEIIVTDVTKEDIARMTTEEMDRYNQVYQDFYSHMYD